jgi:hypothetical protein
MTLGHQGRLGETLWLRDRLYVLVPALLVFLVTLAPGRDGFWLASHSAARRVLVYDQ